jgi:hypothetical protein
VVIALSDIGKRKPPSDNERYAQSPSGRPIKTVPLKNGPEWGQGAANLAIEVLLPAEYWEAPR